MPLTASHTPLLTLHMLWVDLSKCFMEFSREVGQLLQARRGVPAQVRKAVWNLYSRPHGSFDSAFGCWHAPTSGACVAACRALTQQVFIMRNQRANLHAILCAQMHVLTVVEALRLHDYYRDEAPPTYHDPYICGISARGTLFAITSAHRAVRRCEHVSCTLLSLR